MIPLQIIIKYAVVMESRVIVYVCMLWFDKGDNLEL